MPRSWDDREKEFEARPGLTAFKWALGICLGFLLLMVVLMPFNAGFAWLQEGKRVTGPENSRQQTTAVLQDEQAMVALAGNVCEIDQEGDKTSANDPQIVGGSPRFQYAAKYRETKADYDRRMGNFFEAAVTKELPIPKALRSYPETAPTLEARMDEVCPETKGGRKQK